MYNRIYSAAILGIEAVPVTVEADIGPGLPGFTMVGFITSKVREAEERVKTALKNTDIPLPEKRITINLSPADIRKDGSRYDLAIACVILAATGVIPSETLPDVMVLGELGLNGEIRPVPGVLPSVILARKMGLRTCIVPKSNRREGQCFHGRGTHPVFHRRRHSRRRDGGTDRNGKRGRRFPGYPRAGDRKEGGAHRSGRFS